MSLWVRFLMLFTLSVCFISNPLLTVAAEDQSAIPPIPEKFKHIKPEATGNISPESRALAGDRTGIYNRPNTGDIVRKVRLIVFVTSDSSAIAIHGVGPMIDTATLDAGQKGGWFFSEATIYSDNQGRKHLKFASQSGNKFDFYIGPDGRLWGDSHNREGEHRGIVKMQ